MQIEVDASGLAAAEGFERATPGQDEGDAGNSLDALGGARRHEVYALLPEVERFAEERGGRIHDEPTAAARGHAGHRRERVQEARGRLVVDQRDMADFGVPGKRLVNARGIDGRHGVRGDHVDRDPVGPGDPGHPVAVDAIVDDEERSVGRNDRGDRRLHRGRTRTGEQHPAPAVTGAAQPDEAAPHASHHLEAFRLAVTEVGHHQRPAHRSSCVGGPGVEEHPLALSHRRPESTGLEPNHKRELRSVHAVPLGALYEGKRLGLFRGGHLELIRRGLDVAGKDLPVALFDAH